MPQPPNKKKIYFDHNYPKGSPQNPAIVVVRQESEENKTLSVTLTKNVIFMGSSGPGSTDAIQRGDRLAQWVDPHSKVIYMVKLSEEQQ